LATANGRRREQRVTEAALDGTKMASRPTSPVMLVHLFETREEAETCLAAW
jgi:hypothetical protein